MLFIFDWDDTLFPTTQLNSISNKNQYFKLLIKIIKLLFDKCLKYGKIIIITNANYSWINECLKNYMQDLYYYIKKYNIYIISARVISLNMNIQVPNQWKKYTFNHLLPKLKYYFKKDNIIISIGDSYLERDALLEYSDKNIIKKVIKMISNPNPHIILLQLIDINKTFENIILNNQNKNITIR